MKAQQLKSLAPLVDELGALQAELAEIRRGQAESLRDKTKREDELKKAIRSVFKEAPAKKSYSIPGKSYTAEVSACEPRRAVKDAVAVLKKLGTKVFCGLVTIPVTKLEKLVDAGEFDKLVETQPTGPRTLKVSAK